MISPELDRAPLAPPWHTAALVALIAGVAILGTALRAAGHEPAGAAPVAAHPAAQLAVVALVQGALAVYVTVVARPRSALAALVGRRWDRPSRAAVDVALAVAAWLAVLALEAALAPRAVVAPAVSLPHTVGDRLAWTPLAIVVGASEELVYRGYLQAQIGAFARSPAVGIVAQAVLFGVAHLDRGPSAFRYALYGLLFGLLARGRRSLLPGMIAHAWTDVAAGWWGV